MFNLAGFGVSVSEVITGVIKQLADPLAPDVLSSELGFLGAKRTFGHFVVPETELRLAHEV